MIIAANHLFWKKGSNNLSLFRIVKHVAWVISMNQCVTSSCKDRKYPIQGIFIMKFLFLKLEANGSSFYVYIEQARFCRQHHWFICRALIVKILCLLKLSVEDCRVSAYRSVTGLRVFVESSCVGVRVGVGLWDPIWEIIDVKPNVSEKLVPAKKALFHCNRQRRI